MNPFKKLGFSKTQLDDITEYGNSYAKYIIALGAPFTESQIKLVIRRAYWDGILEGVALKPKSGHMDEEL